MSNKSNSSNDMLKVVVGIVVALVFIWGVTQFNSHEHKDIVAKPIEERIENTTMALKIMLLVLVTVGIVLIAKVVTLLTTKKEEDNGFYPPPTNQRK